jgi:hypothetical protein
MMAELTTLAATVLALAAYLLIVAAGLRLTAQAHALAILIGGAVAVFMIATAIAGQYANILIWHFAALYCGGVAVTVFIYGAVLKSLSLQMCARLGLRKVCSIDELADAVIRKAFDERIALLENGGLVERQQAGFVVTEKGRGAAKRISAVRRAVRIESTGLYSSASQD